MKTAIYLLGVIIAVSGCATGYQQQGFTGGYTDMKLQDDIYKIGFRGNGYCRRERAENLALLRCAEVTLNNGYKFFIIIDEKSINQIGAYTTPVTSTTTGTVNTFGNQAYYSGRTAYSGGQTYVFQAPSVSNTIKCFQDKPENIPVIIYDAVQIRDNIKVQYHLK